MTQAGIVAPETMKKAFITAFVLAFCAGLYLIWRGGMPVLIIGVFSIVCGILYTGGPFPFGYYGLGDLFVLIFFGPVALGGTYYVQALKLTPEALIAGLAPGLLSVALLTVNNLRDLETDRISGKNTLVVRWGKDYARMQYMAALLGAMAIPLVLYISTNAHSHAVLAIVSLFVARRAIRTVFLKEPGIDLNNALADTGKLLLVYSVIFSGGWIL
jgi:1,4-dihydroxy-2-naphthoate octaprenyltransferase